MTADAVRVRDFLSAVYDGIEGFANVRTLPPVEQAFFPVTDAEALEAFVKPRRDRNCYIGVAARRTPGDGSLANCSALPALFTDQDFKDSSEADARRRLDATPLQPNIRVQSGGGVQSWWLLKEPMDLQREAPAAKIMLRRLAHYLEADLSAAEPARILRLPNTTNYKYAPARPVRIEHFNSDRRYNLSEFDEWLPAEPRDMRVLAGPTRNAIPAGSRNAHLTSLAGSMRRRGMMETNITVGLLAENEARCRPPLTDAEVRRIAKSVGRYAPDAAASKPADGGAAAATREFRQIDEDSYTLTLLELGIEFQANYLRRERYETYGELVVLCDLAGARIVDGNILSRGTFNFSNPTARQQRARQLADMSKAPELDWPRLLEELCAKVLAKHGDGEPAVLMRDLPRPSPDDVLDVEGVQLLKQHPVILFGDGGAAKSYLALYLAGRLAQRGLRVGVFDWELCGEDHRDRLERLFGPDMPPVWYRTCRHPLIVELDSLRRLVRRERLDYLVYDSVAFAAHDKPEAAESAISYFRATRQIGPGSMNVAHITKTEGGDQKPFGSAFWHNSARATYYMQRSGESADRREITVGVFNRKANLGRLQPAFGFQFTFSDDRTIVTRTNLADVQEFAEKLPLWQRVTHLLKAGPRTLEEIAKELDAKVDSVMKAVTRSKAFTKVSADGITRIALVERRSA